MTNPITCDQFANELAGFLERDADERARASLEAHALACADCGPLLADLRKLRIDAANLPELAPSRDLWRGIEARIATPVIELQGLGDRGERRDERRIGRRVLLGLAAAGLVAVTAGITHVMTKRALTSSQVPAVAVIRAAPVATVPTAPKPDSTTRPQQVARAEPKSNAPASASARPTTFSSVAATGDGGSSPLQSAAERTYGLEINRLKAIVNQRRARLDPETIGVIDRNLKVVDDAIAQIKQALRKDPASRFLIESLNDALENKVEVLRTAATLPSRM